jgi:hypothetical protein
LAALQRVVERGGARRPLQFQRRRLGEELRLVHERAHAALDQVRADVEDD